MSNKSQNWAITVSGYNLFDVASAFQKSIRRCLEEESMFWAIELWESGKIEYAWQRMIVIASEDVGLAEPNGVSIILDLKKSYDFMKAKNNKHKPEKLPFTHAVIWIARAKKSRYIDMALFEYWYKHSTDKIPVPDWAYDMHTRKGKQKGRGIDHFYQEGAKINNDGKVPGEEEMLKKALVTEKILEKNPNAMLSPNSIQVDEETGAVKMDL